MANLFKLHALKLTFVIFCFLLQRLSAQTHWTATAASVKFKIKNAGLTVTGDFKAMQANIVFDTLSMAGNSISAMADPNSISTGINLRDGHLKKEEYFDVKQFPEITMKATTFTKGRNHSFTGYFKVRIKDKTKNIPLSFTFAEEGATGQFKAAFMLNRLDFGVGDKSVIMSDSVMVLLDVRVKR